MHDLLEILEHAFSLMDGFSSVHITTCSLTICALLLFLVSTFHLNYNVVAYMCPNRIKSGLDMKGSGSGGGGV